MKVIVYDSDSGVLPHQQNQLSRHGFQVLAATNNLNRVRDLAGEFNTSLGLLGPEAMEFLRAKEEIEQAFPIHDSDSFPSSVQLMSTWAHPPLMSLALWQAAVQLASERYEAGIAALHTGMYLQDHCFNLPRGYESLPTSWLVALPGLIQLLINKSWARAELGFIRGFRVQEGALDMVFEGEGLNSVSGIPANKIDALRSATRKFLNRHLYPSRWALLLPQHQVEIGNEHPELEAEIVHLHREV